MGKIFLLNAIEEGLSNESAMIQLYMYAVISVSSPARYQTDLSQSKRGDALQYKDSSSTKRVKYSQICSCGRSQPLLALSTLPGITCLEGL